MNSLVKRKIVLGVFLTISSFWAVAGDVDTLVKKKPFWKELRNPLEFKWKRLTVALFPVCSYDPASGVELGIMPVFSVSPKDTSSSKYYRASSLVNHLTYSTNEWINIRNDGQYFTPSGFCYKSFTQYLNAPDYFYGIGNDTLNPNPSSFNYEYFKAVFEVTKTIKQKHFLGLKVDFMTTSISKETGAFLNSEISGAKGGEMIGIGPVYRLDSRNNVNYPSRGTYAEFSALLFQKGGEIEYSFNMYNIDFRKYLNPVSDLIIAYQANLNVTTGDVPFYRMPAIGGKYNLRGISNKFMYIDKNCWFTQVELRKMLFWRLGAVAFTGVGNNFRTWDADIITNVKPIYGFGCRFQMVPRDMLNLRFDYSFGPNGDKGFYATVREIF